MVLHAFAPHPLGSQDSWSILDFIGRMNALQRDFYKRRKCVSRATERTCRRRELAIVKPDVQPSGILQTGGRVGSMMKTQNSRGGREGALPPPINSGKINPCARKIKTKHPSRCWGRKCLLWIDCVIHDIAPASHLKKVPSCCAEDMSNVKQIGMPLSGKESPAL